MLALLAALALNVTIEKPWVREPIAGRPITAGYFVIHNPTEKTIRLRSVSTKAANVTEMHRMVTKDEMMKMEKLDFIDVPAKSSVELKPGGTHLMLIELAKPLKDGDTIALELDFGNEILTIDAPVRKIP
jgi:copper(I)-binding protein